MTSPVLLTPRIIGDVNRSRVIGAFCDHGPTTRADLARLAGVPRATIGAIVAGLIDDELLEELEPHHEPGQVGKPGTPLWFQERAALSVGVSVDASGVRAALVNARGDILDRTQIGFDAAAARASELGAAVVRAVGSVVPAEQILGIGVSFPGVVAAGGTVLGSGQVPAGVGTVLRDALATATPATVIVDNDARVQALGEKWFGDGRGIPTFASVQTGLGLGVGLVLGSVLFRGDDGLVGELGHSQVDPDGALCACGLVGCWETIATLRWVRLQAVAAGLPADVDSQALVELGATALLEAYADNLGRGLATLVHLLGTRTLLLHGDVVGGGELLRSLVEQATRRRCLPHIREGVHVRLSGLDADASLLGAAGLVLSDRFALAV